MITVATQITFSAHAIVRYCERAFPALDITRARTHLDALAANARIVPIPPEWLAAQALEQAELYLTIGTDLVFPLARGDDGLDPWVAKICLARGGISDKTRSRRNAHNARRRRSRDEYRPARSPR
jgi:hypothetical protein